jgi:uncharacterized SAM-binding protein YcdF (DUF218 family)
MAATVALTEKQERQPSGRPGHRPLIRRVGRCVVGVGAGLATLWLLGFAWYLYLGLSGVPAPTHVDAIVALTGGPDRVEIALHLLEDDAGDRLLVSGAGEHTELAALAHRAGIDPTAFERRITLGHAARTTRGNALETAAWARDERVGSLLVVTAWFHMPRAMVELHRAMPGETIEAFPVGRPTAEELIHGGLAKRVIGEYHKYLAAVAGLTASPVAISLWGSEPTG